MLQASIELPADVLGGLAQLDPSPLLRSMALAALMSPTGAAGIHESHKRSIAERALADTEPEVHELAKLVIEQLDAVVEPPGDDVPQGEEQTP